MIFNLRNFLVIACQAKQITISSTGAYVARCFIEIRDDLGSLTLASGNIYAGQTQNMDLPDQIDWMKIRCENQRLVGKWTEFFSQESNGPRTLCYTMGGTTFHPTHSARVC